MSLNVEYGPISLAGSVAAAAGVGGLTGSEANIQNLLAAQGIQTGPASTGGGAFSVQGAGATAAAPVSAGGQDTGMWTEADFPILGMSHEAYDQKQKAMGAATLSRQQFEAAQARQRAKVGTPRF